jgi:hypothetical protein
MGTPPCGSGEQCVYGNCAFYTAAIKTAQNSGASVDCTHIHAKVMNVHRGYTSTQPLFVASVRKIQNACPTTSTPQAQDLCKKTIVKTWLDTFLITLSLTVLIFQYARLLYTDHGVGNP